MSRKLQRTEVCADCSAPGKINQNRPICWNNTPRGRSEGTAGPGLLSLSAGPQSRETTGAPERRVGPELTENRRYHNEKHLWLKAAKCSVGQFLC